MRIWGIICFTATLLFIPVTLHAQNLNIDQAKEAGYVGELPNGLVGIVIQPPHPEHLKSLVENTNNGRMLAYKAAAKKKNLPIKYVQLKASQRLYQTAGPGHYYYKNGSWVKK